jgi:hypothetical protein
MRISGSGIRKKDQFYVLQMGAGARNRMNRRKD